MPDTARTVPRLAVREPDSAPKCGPKFDSVVGPDAGILPLEAHGLELEIGGRRLIKGIDLMLNGGARTVILGANGAGKSLLLRLLHGLLRPSRGEVRWAGRPADAAITHRQAMVFQRPVLLRRSVAANIRYALAAARVPRAERTQRMNAALALAQLTHLARRPARVLSGGEQQRLAIARALSTRPQMLFLDEPSASLDPASTLAVEELIRTACRQGTKIVLVTHDLGQARRIADEVVFLQYGRLVEHTPADRFFTTPGRQAAAFLEGRLDLQEPR